MPIHHLIDVPKRASHETGSEALKGGLPVLKSERKILLPLEGLVHDDIPQGVLGGYAWRTNTPTENRTAI